jgi:serine/threonine protein kinase
MLPLVSERFGPFVIEETIAIGGSAEIFRARRDGGSSEPVALKRLLPALRADPEARAMLEVEGDLHARMRHPNVVALRAHGETAGEPYLALELVEGTDLHRVNRLALSRQRPIATTVAATIAVALLEALSAVHAATDDAGAPLGVVHRDVSPSNVLLGLDGSVKLADFGVALSSAVPRARGPAPTRGKIAYLAPEQVASEPLDARADLFAVGNLLAEMLLGRPLFTGSGQLAMLLAIRDARLDALDAGPKLPAALDRILRTALAKRREGRFADAAAFADALRPFAWQDPSAARRELASLVRSATEAASARAAMRLTPSREDVRQMRELLAGQQKPAPSKLPPPTAPSAEQATPNVEVPPISARPALALEADALRASPSPRPANGDATTAPFASMSSYVQTAEGRLIGPLGYAKLVELVATGQLARDAKVDLGGSGFRRLTEIGELARHLALRSPVTERVDGLGAPALVMPAFDEESRLPGAAKALRWIATNAATGVLLASRGAHRKDVYVREGRLLHVATSEPEELLGEYLVARELLDRNELEFALAVLPRFGGRLGEALGALGLVDPVRLFREIQNQGRDRVAELFRWKTGELRFHLGEQPSQVEFPLELALGAVFEAGVERAFDHQALHARFADAGVEIEAAAPVAGSDEAPNRIDGWSPLSQRALALSRFPVPASAVLAKLHREGHRHGPSERALGALELAGALKRVRRA